MATTAIEMLVKSIADMTTEEMRAFANASDLHWAAVCEVTEVVRLVTNIEEELRQQIDIAQRNLGQALTNLGAAAGINECGILQNAALRIDQLAARRGDALNRLTGACRIVAAIADVVGSHHIA